MALARRGQPAKAERALQAALEHGDRDLRARAAFLLTVLRQERGELPAHEAVARLVAQRPGWHGHPWEARMLRRLAELQAASGQPVAALGSLAAARAQAPDDAAAAAIGREQQTRLRALLRASGEEALPTVAALALQRTYGHLLDSTPGDGEIRLALAARAAASGLLESAAMLLDGSSAGESPAADHDAAELALAAAAGAAGDSAGALARLGGKAPTPPAQARLRAQVRAEAAYRAGDGRAAVEALAGVPGADAARLRWAALRRQQDWAALARSAAAPPPEAAADAPDTLATEAATWLALAQHELGQDGAEPGQRHGGDTADALLQLARQSGPKAVTAADLPSAIGAYAADVREALERLPALTHDGGTALRSATARSTPAG